MPVFRRCGRCGQRVPVGAECKCREKIQTFSRCGKCGRKINTGAVCVCKREKKREYNMRYDSFSRDTKSASFYASTAWKRARQLIMQRHHNICLCCLYWDRKINAADLVHHIIEITTDHGWTSKLDISLMVPLCDACHAWIHKKYTEVERELMLEYLQRWLREFGSS